MSRYIDADALIRQIECPYTEPTVMIQIRRALKEFINSAPSIDIVRCRECKHREEYPCKVYHDDDWYCADGERSRQ